MEKQVQCLRSSLIIGIGDVSISAEDRPPSHPVKPHNQPSPVDTTSSLSEGTVDDDDDDEFYDDEFEDEEEENHNATSFKFLLAGGIAGAGMQSLLRI